jgi:prefoldin subunit 5
MSVQSSTLSSTQVQQLTIALDPTTTTTQSSPVIVSPTAQNLTSTNAAENPIPGSLSNTPLAATGNAATSASAIKKSNENLAHACDSSSYVGMTVYGIGAIAGNFIQSIRAGVKALLAALGVNPSSSSLTNKLNKLAQYIKDITKLISQITNAVQQIISYINAIKELISFILSLPKILLNYFADCIKTLEKQLVAGYKGAFTDQGDAPSQSDQDSLNTAISGVKSNINQFTQSVSTLAQTSAALTISLKTPLTVSSGNTQAQQAATSQVFSQLGFAPPSPPQKP